MRQLTAIIVLVAALAAAGCAPSVPTPPAAGSPSAGATPARGGTAVIAIWQEPAALNPLYGSTVVATVVRGVALEGLATTAPDGTYVPALAESVPVLGNGLSLGADGKTMEVTWKLRPGLKWSDGAPLTSADVKFTWERWMADKKVTSRTGFSAITAIDTPDELTAVVKYGSLYAPYPLNFFAVLPKHLYEKEPDLSVSAYNRLPVGTGPFRLTEFKTGESITAERNPHYREAGKPYLDRIIFKSVPSSQVAIAQLKAGEVQGMWSLLESEAPDLENVSGLTVIVDEAPSVERIELNTAKNEDMTDPNSVHPVLGDIEMRKALLYATPKQELIDKLLFGKARVGSSPISQGWAAFGEPQEAYDRQKAIDTLERAGWTKGADGIRSKAGVRASLTISTTTGNQTRERVEQVLVDEYKAIGVELAIRNQPSSVILGGSWARGDPRFRGSFDMVMYASSPGSDPHFTMLRYTTGGIPSLQNEGAGQNFTRFKSPIADRAVAEAGATLDLEKRKSAYHTALRELAKAYVVIWLYDRADLDAHRDELRGWSKHPWQEFTFNTEDWYLSR